VVRALLLWTLLAGAGDATRGASGGPKSAAGGGVVEPSAAVRTPVPELRLGGGAFTLRLNTGWLGAQPLAPSQSPPTIDHPFDIGGGVDLSQRRGRLRLGGGDERRLRLAVQWDIAVESDMARVHSQIDLGFLGHRLTLTPPDVRVRPRFDGGQPGVDVSVPIVEGRF
jgi:hypothetical protein